MKVAVVHEWLVDYSGSERMLEQLLKMFPNADLFAVVDFLPDDLRYFIQHKPVKTTFIQAFPLARKRYRYYLPLMPLAIEQLDLSEYELILSSSHAVSKEVLTGPDQLHICYPAMRKSSRRLGSRPRRESYQYRRVYDGARPKAHFLNKTDNGHTPAPRL